MKCERCGFSSGEGIAEGLLVMILFLCGSLITFAGNVIVTLCLGLWEVSKLVYELLTMEDEDNEAQN